MDGTALNRREFLRASAAGVVLAMAARSGPAEDVKRRYNVLLVMSDQHNPRCSAPYGHAFVQTPNMARLAREGVLYENAYCPSPLCMPSRCAFLAGRRVHQIQYYNNCNLFDAPYPTYAQVLGEQGVHAVHIGKTDGFRPAVELGFSEMILPKDRKKPGDVAIIRNPLWIREEGTRRAGEFGPRASPFEEDDRAVDAAVEWLRTRGTDLESPWVVSINLVKPHFPQYVTEELWALYADHGDLPEFGQEEESAKHPYAHDLRRHFQTDTFTEAHIRGLRRGYYGCVTYVDRQLGRLLDTLDTADLREKTVVIYTSDHGEMLGKFGLWWKSSLYEDSVRVPLIISGPGFGPGARVTTPVDLLDVQATIFRTVGAQRPADWIGAPLQDIPANDGSRVVFSEYHGHGVRSGAFMIRQGPWKLLYNMAAPHQLFNLDDDPEELRNLAEKNPQKLRELEARLREICSPEEENLRAHQHDELILSTLERIAASSAPQRQ